MYNSSFLGMPPFKARTARCSTVLVRIKEPIWESDQLEAFKPVLCARGPTRVIVDLSNVQQMAVAAIAQLLTVKHLLQRRGREMYIRGLQAQPRTLRNLLGLREVLCSEQAENVVKEESELENPDGVPPASCH